MSTLTFIGLFFFTFVIAFQLMYLFVTLVHTKKSTYVNRDLDEIKMSILIPAFNEESVLENCLIGMNSLHYTNFEAIFINDGSSDQTMPLLMRILELEPIQKQSNGQLKYADIKGIYQSVKYHNMMVIDKHNGGKADSLNAGSDFSSGDVIITLDADSILDADSLLHINEQFHDSSVIAAGGMVHVGQMLDKKGNPIFKGNALLKYQLSEYLTSFYVRKFTQSKLNVIAIVSGAFGAFRRELLYEIGGYKKTLGEDMEITLNIQKVIEASNRKSRMVFIPRAMCYTEVPENVMDMFKQRVRWQKGFIDCVVKYRKDFFSALGLKFSLFFFWDSLSMSMLSVLAAIITPIIILTDKVTPFFLQCLLLSVMLQLLFRVVGYWTATRYHHTYSKTAYIRITLFFLIESVVRPFIEAFIFVYGSLSYFLQKDKHNWNKVKRLGNVVAKEL
jgi:cellulose synthase/poly-beta-1,6-N-acetylglucosamine synthase-like glycosyltransferase